MISSWWNTGQNIASRQNRQQKEEVPHRDTGVGNGTQTSSVLDILDN